MRAALQKRGWGVPIVAPVGPSGPIEAGRGRPAGFRQGKWSPVVQIPPVGGPPRRSADRTPKPPPAVRTENLQVASSTRAANARNKPVVQVIRTVKRVRNFTFCIWRSPVAAQIEAVGRTKVDDEDGDGDFIDIDSDSGP